MRARIFADCVFAVLLATSMAGVAAADVTRGPFDARFSLSVGGFFTDHDTSIRLDTTAGPGTFINLEDDLGLDSTTQILRIDGFWHFAARHRAHFATFDLSQQGIRTLDKDILIDGELFSVGETVATDWDLILYEIGYSYLLVGRPRFQWWFNVAAFIQDTSITVAETVTGGDFSTEDVVLPLPKLGTIVEYAFTNRWIGRAGVDIFKLEIGDVGGSLLDFRMTLDYRFTDRFSLGVGWHWIDIEVDLDKSVSGWRGRLDWETHGLMFYGSLDW